jgi:hypothetical protein
VPDEANPYQRWVAALLLAFVRRYTSTHLATPSGLCAFFDDAE